MALLRELAARTADALETDPSDLLGLWGHEVRTTLGAGTTFIVTLPRRQHKGEDLRHAA